METVGPTTSSIYEQKMTEFRPARRQYNGIGSRSGGDGFWIETLNPDPGRKRGASEAGLDDQGHGSKRGGEGPDFVDSLLDPELSFGDAVSRICSIGAGLENLGNTCYLNSVLQCLTYTEPLAAYLQSGKHQSSCRVAGFCVLCAIQKHVSRALESRGRSLVPKDLVSNLQCISRDFRNARQEDAHEYMVNLLESMHKCCLPSGVPYESPAAYDKSLVHKIFGGRLRSQVECQQCFFLSDNFDPFLDLSLEIYKADSVPLALRNFTASELLGEGEKHYQCQRCRDKVKAKKRLTVHKAPYVLTVHLKRFHPLDPGRKVDRKVVFDNSLNLKPFYSGSYEGDLKYSLYGVLVHLGHNTHAGHYICFIRTSNGIWYLLNDNEVRPVSEKTVLDQNAYMLFYVRERKNALSQKSADIIKEENAKANETLLFRQFNKDQRSRVSVDTTTNAAVLSPKAEKMNANVPDNLQQEESIQVNSIGSLSDGTKRGADPGFKPSRMSKHLPDNSIIKAEPEFKPSSISTSNDQPYSSSLSVDHNHHPSPPRASFSCKPGGGAANSTASRATELFVSSSRNASPCLAAMSNQASQMINRVLPGMVPGKVPAEGTTIAAPEDGKRISDLEDFGLEGTKAGLGQSPEEPRFAIDQGGGYYSGSANTNSLSRNAHDVQILDVSAQGTHKETVIKDDTNPEQSTSVVLNDTWNGEASNDAGSVSVNFRSATPLSVDSGCSATTSTLVTPEETPNCEVSDSKTCGKSKKTLVKCPIPVLRLGVGLFRSSFGIQKRKKHRKFKHNIVQVKALRGSLVDDSGCLQLNQAQSGIGLKESNSSGENLSGEVQMEDNLKAAEVAFDKKCKEGIVSTSEDTLQVANRLGCTNDSKAIGEQTELASTPTLGLKETKVPRWDDVELPPISVNDTNSSVVKSIGYIPDEWDEDYDQGKRKKIRQFKRELGGSNPFQEITIKKSRGQRDEDHDQRNRKKTRQFKKSRVQK